MRRNVAVIQKGKGRVLRVRLDEYRGRDIIDIRICAKVGDTLHPSRMGVAISIWRLPELIEALREAEIQARLAGIFEGQPPRRFRGGASHPQIRAVGRRMDEACARAIDLDKDPEE